MELIDRYLHAIRPWLPLGAPRDEILRELSEDIRSEVDERRGEGGAVSEAEMVAILKARGHPMAVAARFGAGDALVGPRFYPIFRLVVKIVLGYVLLPILAVICLLTAVLSAHPFTAGIEALLSSVQTAFTFLGVIVTVFVILERYAKASDLAVEWDPRRLPRVPRTQGDKVRWNAMGIIAGNIVLAIAFGSFARGLPLLIPFIHDASMGGALPGAETTALFDSIWRMVVALAMVNIAAASIMIARRDMARPCTLAVASANAILGAVILAAVFAHSGSVLDAATIIRGLEALKAAGPSADAYQVGVVLGPALDGIGVIIFFACGVGCLGSAIAEAWRYAKL